MPSLGVSNFNGCLHSGQSTVFPIITCCNDAVYEAFTAAAVTAAFRETGAWSFNEELIIKLAIENHTKVKEDEEIQRFNGLDRAVEENVKIIRSVLEEFHGRAKKVMDSGKR